jgi:hypothetical protein
MLSSSSQQINGEYYIDYHPDNFQKILVFMRTKSASKIHTQDMNKRTELQNDFSFFGLPFPHFRSDLCPLPLEETFAKWLPSHSFSMLYKATRDGFGPKDFHNACDNKGPSISIIRTKQGDLCGGYSPLPWSSDGDETTHPDLFLFTLSNPHKIPPTQFKLKKGSPFGQLNDAEFHIAFGFGFLVRGRGLGTFEWNAHYEDTTGKGEHLFTGRSLCPIEDIEVYRVI